MFLLPYVLGCLAAVMNAATNVMQRSANREESHRLQFSLRLIGQLLRRRLWLAGVATMMASFILQAAALGTGTLAAIEPLLVLELPLTLVAARWFLKGKLGRREWAAITVMTAGTFGLIAFLGPSNGRDTGIGWLLWVLAILATLLPIGALFWLGYRTSSPGRRAALLGVGAGLGFGLAAALTKGMTAQYASGGLIGVIASWQLYGAGAAGAFAFWLNQNAINAGRLAAAQPGVTLGDPYVSIMWGAVVFDEPMRGGLWIAAAVVCGLAMSAGAFVLARSPVISGPQGSSEDNSEGRGNGAEKEARSSGRRGNGAKQQASSSGRSQRRPR